MMKETMDEFDQAGARWPLTPGRSSPMANGCSRPQRTYRARASRWRGENSRSSLRTPGLNSQTRPGRRSRKPGKRAAATDAYVHHSPWKAIGVAAAAGMLIGILVARR